MIFAKLSTAIIVTVGPVLDAAGVAVTGGVVADFKLSKNGGAPAALNGSATLTHRHTGFYSLSLTATDVNTLGTAEVVIDDTVNTCPMKEIMVLPANSYDALVSGSGVGMRADVQGWLGTAPATPTVNGVPEVDLTHWLGTAAATPTVAGVPEVDVTHIGGDAQSAIDLKDFADAGYDPATNKVQGVVLTDTVTTYTGNTVQTGDAFARLGAPAGASVSADIATIEAQTDDIGVAGAGLTALGDVRIANLDVAVSSRLATAGYTAPDNTNIANIIADTNDIQSRLPAALVGGRMASNAEVVGDKNGYALSSAGVTAIWDEVVEGAYKAREYFRGIAAAVMGKSSLHEVGTPKYRDVGDTKDRIDAVTDANGNRTAVIIDLT